MSVSKFLANLIFKKSVQKQTGIMKTINPMEKKLAENKAKFALQQIQKNNNIDINNLSANDLEILAENIVNPIKNATQTPVKSADILDFRYKRSFAEELADASKKGDFNRMTGIMKVDPKFKEVMESLKASKAADAAKAKMIGPKKLIPDRDVIPYQSPEVQKLNFADKLKRAGLTEQEYMDNIVKKGYNVDDAIYAGDFYGDTTDQIIKNANTKGAPVAFAGGGVAGLLGERTGYEGGLRANAPNPRILELMLNEKMSYEDALKEFEMREKQRPYIEERMGTGPGPILEAASGGIARQNFKMGKRAFLKLMGGFGAGIAGLKSGLLGLGGKQATKKAVTETVKSAGSGAPPPYFFKLVDKIKTLGDDVTPSYAVKDRQKVTKYKDYELTEDVTTGEQTIQRMKIDDDLKYDASDYYGKPVGEDVYMSYKPGKGQMDETMKGKTPPDEYTEDTSLIRGDKPAEGEIMDTFDGVPDDILEEVGETIVKKADGGRIGYNIGGLSKLGITGSSRKFLEKVFGKEKFKNMIENDPELHRGMLEVAEMFRTKDKAGLVEYMQNFLPQMSKKELETFVVGSGDTAGIEGQLIRLGSGRDYKNKIEMIEESNNLKKLKDFDIDGVSKNAEGGRIGFSGGGIFRAIIAKSAAKKGLSVTDFIKATNYKALPPEVRMYISPEDFAALKGGQKEMYDNYIDMAKTRLNFQKNVEGGKNTPARELFEGMEKTMDEQSFVPKTVTADDIAEMELMVKNRFNKGRKDNAEGGLQTMLGE